VLQIAAILVLGAVTVSRFHIFAEVDERAHLAYVQEVAEHGCIPWVGRDHVSWQELAIEKGTYPRPSGLDPRLPGLRDSSYEGWQPPLYYVLASPAYLIPSGYRDKILAVRAFDLLLLLVAVVILALLARAVFRERWPIPYCLALSTMLWPGVLVRAITVSNAALEIPLVLLYVLVVWNATVRPRARSLLVAGGLLGLCVLTQLTLGCMAILLIVPLVALLRARRDRRAVGTAMLALVLPVVLVAPWLALNESRYGALTASSLVERLTVANAPTGSGVGAVASGLVRFTHAALPQEWWQEYNGALGVILIALPALLLLIAALPVMQHPRLLRSQAAGLLAAPLPLGLATLVGIALLAEWPASLFPRYVNPMFPLFALFAAWAWTQARVERKSLFWFASLSALMASLAWIYMGGAYYFTNVGAKLGIHAAGIVTITRTSRL
jgi:4-amino-4-deoxy-L-arabinose transferase-like glycosyltransferase